VRYAGFAKKREESEGAPKSLSRGGVCESVVQSEKGGSYAPMTWRLLELDVREKQTEKKFLNSTLRPLFRQFDHPNFP
jgi:hypothetical protein